MNTDVHVVIVGGSVDQLDRAEHGVRSREDRWSRFLPNSELSQLNRAAGRPVVVSADTFALIQDAVKAFHLTEGAFDPTVLSTLTAAGYDRTFDQIEQGSEGRHVPAPTPVDVEFLDAASAIVVPRGIGLDLGGIGKGATADAVVDELIADGVDGCCVNIGGDVRVSGQAPDPRGWTITLECPGSDTTRPIVLAAGAVCTSTITRRHWISSIGAEHHLRDPVTGRPHPPDLVSVSVIAARAAQAEVLTKVAFAAGLADAAKAVEAHRATGLLVDHTGAVTEFDAFHNYELVSPAVAS